MFFFESIGNFSKLKELNLTGNRIGFVRQIGTAMANLRPFETISDNLKKLTNLETLDLIDNCIDDYGIENNAT
jgi:Leucine-rich repeat (LRR) protein